ncbi:Integrase zinc binding domain [Popillia japonica]|uniref:Integrase zinc binding domain n=1 Tax=Popillia japonica TaxID=7064 RepID=A0AAW1ITX6_POPJA
MDKTMAAISGLYWFPGMRRYLKKYISCCLPCLYNKEPGGKKPGYLHPIEKVAVPFDTLHVDHLGPFVKSKRKNTYLIVIVDAFTKFVFMKAVPSSKTGPLLNFLDTVIENFGVPLHESCAVVEDRTTSEFFGHCNRKFWCTTTDNFG